MGLFDRLKQAPVTVRDTVARRAQMVPTHEIGSWVEQSISATGVHFRQFSRERSLNGLDEAIADAETTLSLLRVLKERVEQP